MSYPLSPLPRHWTSRARVFVVIGAIFLIVIGSIVLIYTTITNQVTANNAAGTATAQAYAQSTHVAFDATGTANAFATVQAQQTAIAQANQTATAIAKATATANAQASATASARATAFAAANATATAQAYASRDPYAPYAGNLTLYDPLYSNSQGLGWDIYSLPTNNNCQFTGGAYESTSQNQVGAYYDISNICIAEKTNFSDFTLQANVTILKGGCGGIAFRGNSKTNNMYEFVVCASPTEITPAGDWALRVAGAGSYYGNLAEGYSSIIRTIYGHTNVLAVVAIGHTFTLYVNGLKMTTITNTFLSAGQIGLISSGSQGILDVVMFHNVEVWTF